MRKKCYDTGRAQPNGQDIFDIFHLIEKQYDENQEIETQLNYQGPINAINMFNMNKRLKILQHKT